MKRVRQGTSPTRRMLLQAAAATTAIGNLAGASVAQSPSARAQGIVAGWQFREFGKGDWLPASVPGTVHTDLLANQKISDPFYRTNERDLQWIDKTDWEYRTQLDVDAKMLAHDHVELVFSGLDTYADVYVNEQLVLQADNMFRTWASDIKAAAVIGKNALRVVLRSPVQEGLKLLAGLGYNPPAPNDLSEIGGLGDKKISMFTRKAAYHYGWDWGPRFVTSGIWRPVQLRAWNAARIADLHIMQNEVSAATARLTARFEILADAAGSAVIDVSSPSDRTVRVRRQIQLKPGLNTAALEFTIHRPKLWWTNALGPASLYEFVGRLTTDRIAEAKSVTTGLRSVKVVQRPDSGGTGFLFELNGVPVFMKGANCIPNDSFLPRVTRAVYERLIKSAVETNMNMLRVWGGGIYEDDYFYELCDRNGILVWQDFMFACMLFPGDQAFLDNVRQEAIDNVKRLRNHPCIALWVGNNEIDRVWTPGWLEKYSQAQFDAMWTSYQGIFHRTLPEVVAAHDGTRFYWPSTYIAAWDGKEVKHANIDGLLQSGDIHYWGVWWRKEPFSAYRTYVGRFMSEYGFQSFPEFRTVKAYADRASDHDISSEVMEAHQRSSIGNGTIKAYMERDYKVPADFRQFLYVGQVLQAEGVRVAMEGHRSRMPYCMGSLIWQLNDCWPVASWSSIDYYGRWKALQYFARKSFAPELVTSWVDGDTVCISALTDRLSNKPAQLQLKLTDFRGKVLRTLSQSITLMGRSVARFTIPVDELLGRAVPETVVLQTSLISGHRILAEDLLYFRPVKDLKLPKPVIARAIMPVGDQIAIGLTSDVLVKNLYLFNDAVDGFFSDNYFDLPARTKKIVYFEPTVAVRLKTFERSLTMMNMAEIT